MVFLFDKSDIILTSDMQKYTFEFCYHGSDEDMCFLTFGYGTTLGRYTTRNLKNRDQLIGESPCLSKQTGAFLCLINGYIQRSAQVSAKTLLYNKKTTRPSRASVTGDT